MTLKEDLNYKKQKDGHKKYFLGEKREYNRDNQAPQPTENEVRDAVATYKENGGVIEKLGYQAETIIRGVKTDSDIRSRSTSINKMLDEITLPEDMLRAILGEKKGIQ